MKSGKKPTSSTAGREPVAALSWVGTMRRPSLILGLDPSQSTGYALMAAGADLSQTVCGTIRATGDSYEAKAADLGRHLVKIIKAERPDFALIEQPLRMQPGPSKRRMKFMGEEAEEAPSSSGINAVISSNQMVGACVAIIGAYRIPFETVRSDSWRKTAYGFGRKPGWARADWKSHARQQCARVGIKVSNDDQAEACWIAFAGTSSQTFRMLRAQAEQPALEGI